MSTGGVSVHSLLASPMARGLFHKAIAQSGCSRDSVLTARPMREDGVDPNYPVSAETIGINFARTMGVVARTRPRWPVCAASARAGPAGRSDYVDLWQMHDIRTLEDVQAVMKPGGAMEAFEAAKKAGKCRLIGFTGHFDPDAHVAMLKAYDHWDTVMMPVHATDHAYLSFEQLPVAVERGVPNRRRKSASIPGATRGPTWDRRAQAVRRHRVRARSCLNKFTSISRPIAS